MQQDSLADLKVIQEWFETNRQRETGIIENIQKQPASPAVSYTHLTLPTKA